MEMSPQSGHDSRFLHLFSGDLHFSQLFFTKVHRTLSVRRSQRLCRLWKERNGTRSSSPRSTERCRPSSSRETPWRTPTLTQRCWRTSATLPRPWRTPMKTCKRQNPNCCLVLSSDKQFCCIYFEEGHFAGLVYIDSPAVLLQTLCLSKESTTAIQRNKNI